MNDMTMTIIAKSDQINAADLIGSPRTVTVREVRIKAGDDQPVTIMIEGDKKAFRPCMGVRRLFVRVWGPDASKYIGQSLTLFRDPSVTWAGKEEGGIRVSHMTGINSKIVEFMRISRTATKPYEILPLIAEVRDLPKQRQTAEQWASDHRAQVDDAASLEALAEVMARGAKPMAKLEAEKPDIWGEVNAAYAARRAAIEREGKPAADMGEGFTDTSEGEWAE